MGPNWINTPARLEQIGQIELEDTVDRHHRLDRSEEIVAEAHQEMTRHQGDAGVREYDAYDGIAVISSEPKPISTSPRQAPLSKKKRDSPNLCIAIHPASAPSKGSAQPAAQRKLEVFHNSHKTKRLPLNVLFERIVDTGVDGVGDCTAFGVDARDGIQVAGSSTQRAHPYLTVAYG